MKGFINSLNKRETIILKKTPFRWILGWYKFAPILVGLFFFAVLLAFLVPTRIYTYSDDDGLEYAAIFIGFLSFMGFVLYVVRQVKFNSFRIHHHIPFAKSITVFFSFWVLITLFAIPAFIPHQIHSWRVKQQVNSITTDFEKDLEILHKGSPFFVVSSRDEKARVLLNSLSDMICLSDSGNGS